MPEKTTVRDVPVEAVNVFKPMTDAQEAEWLKKFNTGFRAREEENPFNAVVRSLNRVSVVARLNDGTKDDKVQTKSVSIGSLNIDRYDEQKAINIVELMKPVLSKDVYDVQETKVSILSNGN